MLVSVIVPVYKAEKWLYRCVDSILAQTMADFELLLVDDGSPDRSGEICDEYAAKDSRVRVFHKENGGVSSARNVGLDNALGEWISFVDADDWVEVDYLAGLTENLDADFITGGMRETIGAVYQLEDELFCGKGIGEFLQKHNKDIFVRAAWGKLIRKQIIDNNNLRFDEKIRFGEDTLFNKQVLLISNKVRVVNCKSYIYYIPSDNIPSDIFGIVKYSLSLREIEYIVQRLCDINSALKIKFAIENLWQDVYYLLLMYNLEEILIERDRRLYCLYKCGFRDKNYKSFCAELDYSPIIRGILKLKELYKSYRLVDIRDFYNIFENYCKNTPWFIKFKYIDFYLWYFLIKCRLWFVFDVLMKLYCNLK